jgi:hypothetical protein
MTRWVIYSACSIFALCSMGALAAPAPGAELINPAPPPAAEDVSTVPAGAERGHGRAGDAPAP